MSFKQVIKNWVPPKLLNTLQRPIKNYFSWRSLRSSVQNWRSCWLSSSYPNLAKVAFGSNILVKNCRHKAHVLAPLEETSVFFHIQEYFEEFNVAIRPNDIVVDIGAHIGFLSIPMASMGANVFSFEPNPENVAILERNKERNKLDNLHVFPVAVASESGTASFEFGATSTLGRLSNSGFTFPRDKNKRVATVETVSLADLLEKHPEWKTIQLLKVDCEGGEYSVLMAPSAKPFLERTQNLVVEVHPVNSGFDKYQLYHHLSDIGYKISVRENWGNGAAEFYCQRTGYGESPQITTAAS